MTKLDKVVMVNQPDITVVDRKREKAIVRDIAIPSDANLKKKENDS